MRRKEGKEEDREQGSLLASIGNMRGFAFFRGKAEGDGRERRGFFEIVFFFFIFPSFMVILWRFLAFGRARGKRRERRGPYENKSQKVPNLAFYSVVSNSFEKIL